MWFFYVRVLSLEAAKEGGGGGNLLIGGDDLKAAWETWPSTARRPGGSF